MSRAIHNQVPKGRYDRCRRAVLGAKPKTALFLHGLQEQWRRKFQKVFGRSDLEGGEDINSGGKRGVEFAGGGEGGLELGAVGAASDGKVRDKGVGAGEGKLQDAGIELVVQRNQFVVAAFDVEQEVFVFLSRNALELDGERSNGGGDGLDVRL